MNIKQYFINKLKQKQLSNALSAKDEDIRIIHEYFAPMKDYLSEDFNAACRAVFLIFKNQISVFTNEQTSFQTAYLDALKTLQQKYPTPENAGVSSASEDAASPEAMAIAKAMQETPEITNFFKVGLLQQLLARHPEHYKNITQEQKTPLKLSQWLTNIVATKSTQGHEDLAGICSALSFEEFRASFQIHSELPALTEFLKQDLQKDFDEVSTTQPMLPSTTLPDYKSDMINIYETFEQQHAVFSSPLVQEAYEAYTALVEILSKHLTKGPRPQSLLASEHAFSHLPKDTEGVTSVAKFQKSVISASMEKPVLVDFWAKWCAPCKQLGPIIDDISQTHSNSLSVIKIDFENAEDVAASQNVRSFPTLALYFKGKEIGRIIGFRPKDAILSFISESLSKESTPQ